MYNENETLETMLEQEVCIGLANGIKLEGTMLGFDDYTIILDDKQKMPQVVYKTSITTVGRKRSYNR